MPGAITPLSEGDVRLHVTPIRTLAQLDVVTATLRTFRQVESVAVDAVNGETVQLVVRLGEPLAFAGQLRSRLGDAVLSVHAEADHLEVALDPGRHWIVEPPADAPAPPAAHRGRAVAPLVPARPGPPDAERPPGVPSRAAEIPPMLRTAADAASEDRRGVEARRTPGARGSARPPAEADAGADVLARNVLDAIPDTSVLVLDTALLLRAVAGTALARRGLPRERLLGRSAREALPILPWDLLEPACRAAFHGDASAREFETLDHGGVFAATISPVRDAADRAGAVIVLRDISSRRRDAAVIADADEMFELSFARAPIGKAIVAPDGRFLKVNAAFCRLLGRDERALLEADFQQITHPEDLDTDVALLHETAGGARDGYVLEKRYLHADGHAVHGQLSVAVVRQDDGAPRWYVAQVVDLTRRRQLEEELRSGAERDGLTGLWNGARLGVELALRAQESRRYGVGASLLAIDLDGFSRVNDVLGPERGDAFLRTVANAIRGAVRDCDHPAHPGEDHFVVLLPHTPAAGAAVVAERLRDALRACDAPGLPPGFLRASMGVAELVPGMTGERWLWHAREACRVAKRAGGDQAVLGTGPDAALGAAAPDDALVAPAREGAGA
jgi:diguanylate cyclase (GGDEF)-like protein/PAS domain S-box-containing protein